MKVLLRPTRRWLDDERRADPLVARSVIALVGQVDMRRFYSVTASTA